MLAEFRCSLTVTCRQWSITVCDDDDDDDDDNNNNNAKDSRETVFLFQRLSIAIQRGNAVSFLSTFTATD